MHPMMIRGKLVVGCSRCSGFHPEGEHTKSTGRFIMERFISIAIAIGVFVISLPIWVAFVVLLIRLAQAWGWL